MTTQQKQMPQDIKPQWLNVIRRLQSACATNKGFAILSISVIVDAEGEPRIWTEPKCTKLEPKKSTEVIDLLSAS